MGDVVSLPVKDERELIWACLCGSTTHHLHVTGAVECAACRRFGQADDNSWRERLPQPAAEVPPVDHSNFKVASIDTAQNFFRRHAKIEGTDTMAVVIVYEDSGVSTWSRDDLAGEERRGWLRRRLDEAFGQISVVPLHGA